MHLELPMEGLLCVTIGNKFKALKQATTAHIADEGMIAEPLLQSTRKICTLRRHICEKVVTPYYPLHGQRRAAGERMTHVGMAMLEGA
jgi:hypothetical protein